MPPKKKEEKKEKPQDDSGIPKNDVNFKIVFEVKQKEVENILIMFQWISATDSSQREKIDTELIEGWDPINPDDPVTVRFEKVIESVRIDEPFAKNICKDKFYIYFVSAEDNKVKDVLYYDYSPLIFSSTPPTLEFSFDKLKIMEIESFKITISADKELLTPQFREQLNPLQITLVGAKDLPDDSDDKYLPVYAKCKFFDGTEIITHELPQGQKCKWKYKHVLLAGLIDHQVLLEKIRTNLFEVEVHNQDEPVKNDIKPFKNLIDLKLQPEEPEPIDPKLKGKAPPPGKKDPKAEKEKADKEKAEAKKKEEKKADKPKDKGKKDAKKKKDIKSFDPIFDLPKKEVISTNYGVSQFNLSDLLKPSVRNFKLRSAITAMREYLNNDAQNLDLNTTARKEIKRAHFSSNFLEAGSYLIIRIEIATKIGPPPVIQIEEPPVVDPKKPPQLTGAGPAKPLDKVKTPPPVKQDPKAKPGAADDKKKAAPPPTEEIKPGSVDSARSPKAVVDDRPKFERAVYIFPYKSPELIPRLLDAVGLINLDAFGQKNPLFLTTKSLSEEEKKNEDLDIITGIEFMDNEHRTFILEGLSAKGMNRLSLLYPRTESNTETLKILKNHDVRFKTRIFSQFNLDIKKVHLRENLTKLLGKPEIYLRNKVPEYLYDTLIVFNEIRKCDNMKEVEALNLFPNPEYLISLERKYGEALSEEDITGREVPPIKIVKRTVNKKTNPDITSDINTTFGSSSKNQPVPLNSASQDKIARTLSGSARRNDSTSHHDNTNLDINKSGSQKLLRSDPYANSLKSNPDHNKLQTYNMHMKKDYPKPEDEPVYNLAGHHKNIYEKQKEELREIVRNDPNHFYTYSVDYLSLSVDPYSIEDAKRREIAQNKAMWKTPEGFRAVVQKGREHYISHPKKPSEARIDELRKYPYHEDIERAEIAAHNTRGDPYREGGKPDFVSYIIHGEKTTLPVIEPTEKLTPVEKERQMREERKREYDNWKSKVVVETLHFNSSTACNKFSQLDKIKGLREDPVKKKGYMLKDNRLKETTLPMDKELQDAPISLFLAEEWKQDPANGIFTRKLDKTKAVSEYDFNRNIQQAHQKSHIARPMKDLFKE